MVFNIKAYILAFLANPFCMKEYFRLDEQGWLKLGKAGCGASKYLADFPTKPQLNIFNIYYGIEKNNYFLLKSSSERNVFV